jgi:predicted MFS family arabinose efflux permease
VKHAILMLALAAANTAMNQRIAEPMLPGLADAYATSVPAVAIIITAYALASSLAQYIHGPLGDRYGALRTVTAMTALSGLASFGCAMAGSLESLTAWRFACGCFASGSMTLGMAYVADVVPAERRQPVLGRFLAGTVSGQTLGPLVGGVLTDLLGWRSTFVALGLVFAVVALVLWATTRHGWAAGPQRSSDRALLSPAPYIGILRTPRARAVLLAVFTEMALFFGAYSFLGALLKERFDLSFTAVGLIMACFGLGGLVYSSLVHRMLRQFGQRGCVLIGGLLGGTLYLVLLAVPSWPLTVPCIIGMGFSFYTLHNTLQTKATEMAPHARASALALFSMLWAGGQAIGSLVIGLGIHLAGYTPVIAASAIGFVAFSLVLRANLHRL